MYQASKTNVVSKLLSGGRELVMDFFKNWILVVFIFNNTKIETLSSRESRGSFFHLEMKPQFDKVNFLMFLLCYVSVNSTLHYNSGLVPVAQQYVPTNPSKM